MCIAGHLHKLWECVLVDLKFIDDWIQSFSKLVYDNGGIEL
jgi:hypothetical protein